MSEAHVELCKKYPVPRVVYQYLPPPEKDRDTTNILSARRFKLSQIGKMNDPFDMLPVFKEVTDELVIRNHIERILKQQGDSAPITPDMIAIYKERQMQIRNNPLVHWLNHAPDRRFLCLSCRDDGVLLWSHYARCHRGFAVGFRSEVLIETEPRTNLFEVEYNDLRPEFDGTATLDEQNDIRNLRALFKRKSPEWTYEQEWRAIHQPQALIDQDFLPFTIDAVDCVIFGALIERDVVTRLNQACTGGGLGSIPLKKARISNKGFGLEIVPTTWIEALKV